MSNSNKNVLITGAGKGIGLGLTKKLLQEGMRVYAVTRSGEIEEFSHPNLTIFQGDIANDASIEKVAKQIADLNIRIDYLINNAGVGPDLMDEVPSANLLRETFATNTTGTVLITEALLDYVNDGGHIVYLSTAMALLRNVAPSGPAYRMSKAAINVYAVMLSQRVASRNISVTPLHPGWVQTRMGGESAPVTLEQSVSGIFKAITENKETGKFWNVDIAGLEDF